VIFSNFQPLRKSCPRSLLNILSREEQDLLEILDLELFGVKILVSILIEPFVATVILLDSCLFEEKN
jgi:hypothetical protein